MKHAMVCFYFLISVLSIHSQTYTPTDNGSKIHFVIRNFGIRTGGDFTGLKGTIVFNPNALSISRIDVTVDAATVDTDNNTRDKHLRSADYFNSEKYPVLGFKSTKVAESTIAGRYFIIGNLTIKGITKQVQFGFSATPVNNGYLFVGEFKINRRDFGVGSNSLVLSDDVSVNLKIAAIK
jgi:polyisoprenoid-binding protein YceI